MRHQVLVTLLPFEKGHCKESYGQGQRTGFRSGSPPTARWHFYPTAEIGARVGQNTRRRPNRAVIGSKNRFLIRKRGSWAAPCEAAIAW